MTSSPHPAGRWARAGRKRLVAAATILVVVLGVPAAYRVWNHLNYDRYHQHMRIPGEPPAVPRLSALPVAAKTSAPPFVTAVSQNRRYLVDQAGKPILVHGDSPWALMTRVSPAQAELWFADREKNGVNAAIVSLIGATANGAPKDDGSTYDGLLPFQHGDILKWQEPYWKRVDAYVRMAEEHGITLMMYPIDGWTIGNAFVPDSVAQCQRFGEKLAARYKNSPNIVWMSGGDYFPPKADRVVGSDVDRCISATLAGLRDSGDRHLFSIQLGYPKSISTDVPYWAARVDWNFVYTYQPTYKAVLDAYRRSPAMPALLGEANYEGENNQKDSPPTTNLTLRRQMLWSLTAGAAGQFMGSQDWQFLDGWEKRLDTPAVAQMGRLQGLFASLNWAALVPDTSSQLVTAGRGKLLATDQTLDVLQNDYVTASRTPDGRLAVIYLPAQHTITVDRSQLKGDITAKWVDPASGASRAVPMSNTFSTPGANSDRDHDWLLLLSD